MSFKKNLLLSVISGLTLSIASNANAVSNEVIYKIHQVKPLKEAGEIVSCDFKITFFNRSYMPVNDLAFDISWKDEVVEERISAEKKEKVSDPRSGASGYSGESKTEKFTSKMVSTSLSIAPLRPGKQLSASGNVKTNRCFLLLEEPELLVRSCSYGDDNNDKTAGVCKNMFKFVSPKSADYYNTFKDISYDEQKKLAQEESNNEQKELNQLYNNAINSVKRTTDALRSMQ